VLILISLAATSTSVEHVFSQGRHVLSFSRNCLTGISIWRFLCLGSWSRKDLVRDDDAVKTVKQVMKGKLKADSDAVKRKQPEEGNEGDGGAGKKARTSYEIIFIPCHDKLAKYTGGCKNYESVPRVDTGHIPAGLYPRVQPAQTQLSSGTGLYPNPDGVRVWQVRVRCRLVIPGPGPVTILTCNHRTIR
jgi:hypothetical protein